MGVPSIRVPREVCCLVLRKFGEVGANGEHGVVWDSACVEEGGGSHFCVVVCIRVGPLEESCVCHLWVGGSDVVVNMCGRGCGGLPVGVVCDGGVRGGEEGRGSVFEGIRGGGGFSVYLGQRFIDDAA